MTDDDEVPDVMNDLLDEAPGGNHERDDDVLYTVESCPSDQN